MSGRCGYAGVRRRPGLTLKYPNPLVVGILVDWFSGDRRPLDGSFFLSWIQFVDVFASLLMFNYCVIAFNMRANLTVALTNSHCQSTICLSKVDLSCHDSSHNPFSNNGFLSNRSCFSLAAFTDGSSMSTSTSTSIAAESLAFPFPFPLMTGAAAAALDFDFFLMGCWTYGV